jgi:hypothetical protein
LTVYVIEAQNSARKPKQKSPQTRMFTGFGTDRAGFEPALPFGNLVFKFFVLNGL